MTRNSSSSSPGTTPLRQVPCPLISFRRFEIRDEKTFCAVRALHLPREIRQSFLERTVSIRARRTPYKLRKLLVIDDDLRLLASYRDLLSPYGFEVLTAPDGTDAMPIVEKNPDILLVILDLAMPRMDGKEWLRWFRNRRKDSSVIVISAYKIDVEDADIKPSVVLEKPFHVAELLDLVGLFCGLGTPLTASRTI
jgi:CheY-like chemotaxis protein